MKYKTKIVPEANGYVGYAILNEQTVFTTNIHPDTVMVMRELSKFIASSAQPSESAIFATKPPPRPYNQPTSFNNAVPTKRKSLSETPSSAETPIVTTTYTPITDPAPRKCCGRG